uniref:Uncharacterized protein n=1 Tax=Neovison vison TaxID=452646 RepID=A0A8C7ENJ4_NEOVI
MQALRVGNPVWGQQLQPDPKPVHPQSPLVVLDQCSNSCCGGTTGLSPPSPHPHLSLLFSPSPGDTRIIYSKIYSKIYSSLECWTHLRAKHLRGTCPRFPGSPALRDEPLTETIRNHMCNSPEDKPAGGKESHFAMDI